MSLPFSHLKIFVIIHPGIYTLIRQTTGRLMESATKHGMQKSGVNKNKIRN